MLPTSSPKTQEAVFCFMMAPYFKPIGLKNQTCEGGIMAIKKVPVWEKANLSLEEAAAYFGIGINKLRDMTNEENCPFVLWNGNKRLIKRKQLERFLETAYSI